ncbi:hypothetical protein LJC60_04390 [Ruminococcaceae bacterium OttesenSCG-928-D13]|nr:hypothetical protein [Ruminococcaceae bacterium OttesenSCG-928-D13]
MFNYRKYSTRPKERSYRNNRGSKISIPNRDYEVWKREYKSRLDEMLEWFEKIRSIGRVNEFDIRLDTEVDKAVEDAVYSAIDKMFK